MSDVPTALLGASDRIRMADNILLRRMYGCSKYYEFNCDYHFCLYYQFASEIQVRNSQLQPQFVKTRKVVVLGGKLRDIVQKNMLDTCTAIVLKLVDIAMKRLQLFQQHHLQQQQPDVPSQIGKAIIGVMM